MCATLVVNNIGLAYDKKMKLEKWINIFMKAMHNDLLTRSLFCIHVFMYRLINYILDWK